MSSTNGLTDKQYLFVQHYLQCWNATEAARQAGYGGDDNTLASIGSENLRKPKIRAKIQARLNTVAMTAEEVLARLSEQARADMGDLLTEDGTPDLAALKQSGLTHLIKTLSFTKYGPRLELYDAQKALELMGRAHGVFTDKHEHTGPDGGPIQLRNVLTILEYPTDGAD